MTNEQKIVAFEKVTGRVFDPNATNFWLRNVSGLSELPEMPNVTEFWLHKVSGLSELPEMQNVTEFWLYDVSGANIVSNCGDNKRCLAAIYGKDGKPYIFIGCWSGDESAAIAAINKKYSGAAADEYVGKIKKTFSLLKK